VDVIFWFVLPSGAVVCVGNLYFVRYE